MRIHRKQLPRRWWAPVRGRTLRSSGIVSLRVFLGAAARAVRANPRPSAGTKAVARQGAASGPHTPPRHNQINFQEALKMKRSKGGTRPTKQTAGGCPMLTACHRDESPFLLIGRGSFTATTLNIYHAPAGCLGPEFWTLGSRAFLDLTYNGCCSF